MKNDLVKLVTFVRLEIAEFKYFLKLVKWEFVVKN